MPGEMSKRDFANAVKRGRSQRRRTPGSPRFSCPTWDMKTVERPSLRPGLYLRRRLCHGARDEFGNAMPFPLAHPAVVLPLRKVQWLSMSAMMLGCLTPDVSYGLHGMSRVAHSFQGTFLFCLPVGLVAYLLFRLIRKPLALLLPSPHRQALLSLCHDRNHSWLAIVVSVWIGACSHVLLDALTHESQMLVPHLVGLRSEIAAIERRGIQFSQLLWFALSAAGLCTLVVAYARVIRQRTGRWSWFDRKETLRYAAWTGLILLPFLIVTFGFDNPSRHWPLRYRVAHFVYNTMALYLVFLSGLILLLGLILRLRQLLTPREYPQQ
jgi:hypothetical protein